MSRLIIIFLFLFLSNKIFSQINYYVGLDVLSTTSQVLENGNKNNKTDINYSTYIGNEISLNNKVSVLIDIVYQNNKNVLKKINNLNTRFELHQTISLLIKPNYCFNKISIGPILGVSGIYLFDKKEDTGQQIDRFDEGYLFGLNFNTSLTPKTALNLALINTIFESVSHYTSTRLNNYKTITIGLQYNLYGSNK